MRREIAVGERERKRHRCGKEKKDSQKVNEIERERIGRESAIERKKPKEKGTLRMVEQAVWKKCERGTERKRFWKRELVR